MSYFVDHKGTSAMKKYPRAKKMTKTFNGKSTKLGHGGRAAMLKSALEKKGIPKKEIGGIIGKLARDKGAAPGGPNYHGKRA